jgi:hypothetical protein
LSGEPEALIHKLKKSDEEKIKQKIVKMINNLPVEEKLDILTNHVGRLTDTIEEVRHKQNKLLTHFDTINYKIDWLEKVILFWKRS